jgi:hypothetical protein
MSLLVLGLVFWIFLSLILSLFLGPFLKQLAEDQFVPV